MKRSPFMVKLSLQAASPSPVLSKVSAKKNVYEVQAWRQKTMHILAIYFKILHGIEFYGQQNIPEGGPLILVANHPSYYDPVLIGQGLGKLWANWLCWDEAFTWPLVGPWIRSLGAIPVNLEKPSTEIMKQSLKVIRAGKILGVFIEGQRSTTPLVQSPLPGAASIALRTGTPIMPVTISGAFRVWPKTQNCPRLHGQIRVIYHPVLNIKKSRLRDRHAEIDLTKKLKRTIQWPLTESGEPFRLSRALKPTFQPTLRNIEQVSRP